METKICFKCGKELPLSEFYRHPQMADGHLNKCKECTKRDMHFQQLRNSKDPSKVEKERERGRLKYHKYKDRYKTEAQQLKRGLYPSLKNTRAYYEIKGIKFRDEYELHHWNYNRIHDVIELPRRLHRRLHTIIRFEPLEGIYYKGGTRLDSLGAHLSVLQDICLEYGFDYEDIAILIESQKANEIH